MDEFRVRIGRIIMHDGGADVRIIAPSSAERETRASISEAIGLMRGDITGYAFVAMDSGGGTVSAYKAPPGIPSILMGDLLRAKLIASITERWTLESLAS